jgi:hypothetical protein
METPSIPLGTTELGRSPQPNSSGSPQTACKQFFTSWNVDYKQNGYESPDITPMYLSDITETDKNLIITKIRNVPKNNILFLILGFQIIPNKKFSEIDKLIEQSTNNIYVIGIDPDSKYFKPGATENNIPIDDYLFKYWKETYQSRIMDTSIIEASFPLTIYNHETTNDSPNMSTRQLYFNNLQVIKELIDYNGELIILSNISKNCYRSFKYIIDLRQKCEKKINVIITHDEESKCDHDNFIFPNAYRNCMDYIPDNWPSRMINFKNIDPKYDKAVKKNKESLESVDQIVSTYTQDNFGLVGGNNYYNKYLKYKNKYLILKNSVK